MPDLAGSPPMGAPALPVALEYDGGDMDCGSGLLLAITSRMRRIEEGEVLLLHTRERSVLADLPAWARLAGHDLLAVVADAAGEHRDPGDCGSLPGAAPTGVAARLQRSGRRVLLGIARPGGHPALALLQLPLQPRLQLLLRRLVAASRRTSDVGRDGGSAAEQFAAAGRSGAADHRWRTLPPPRARRARGPHRNARPGDRADQRDGLRPGQAAGGPRVLRPRPGDSSDQSGLRRTHAARPPAGRRFPRPCARGDPACPRARLPGPGCHDLPARGRRSCRGPARRRWPSSGSREEDRLIRPVAQEGYAEAGVEISLDSVEPEPTLTADGAWWHPVAVTNRHLRVADAPLPLGHVLDVIRDVVAVQAAAGSQGRAVFRCT